MAEDKYLPAAPVTETERHTDIQVNIPIDSQTDAQEGIHQRGWQALKGTDTQAG